MTRRYRTPDEVHDRAVNLAHQVLATDPMPERAPWLHAAEDQVVSMLRARTRDVDALDAVMITLSSIVTAAQLAVELKKMPYEDALLVAVDSNMRIVASAITGEPLR